MSLPVDQLLLGLEEAEQVEAEGFAAEDTADPAKREARASKRRTNRGALPAHLPRIEQVIDIPDKICPCCKGMLHVMGEHRSERLDIVPAQFRVIVTRRPKDAFSRSNSRSWIGRSRKAALPTQSASVDRSRFTPCSGANVVNGGGEDRLYHWSFLRVAFGRAGALQRTPARRLYI